MVNNRMFVANIEHSPRRFGVEIEYNSFDGQSRSRSDHDLPVGIYDIANCISNTVSDVVEVCKWHYTNNNKRWVIKPDSSCGIEVCSPPLRGLNGILEVVKVIENVSLCKNVFADDRCSFHVHVEIEDFSHDQIMFMFEKYVNCEIFLSMMTNPYRWLNQYCTPIGFCKDFSSDKSYTFDQCLQKLSAYKYYGINLYHYAKNKKKTIEFRSMGNECCMDSDDAKNWCKLLLCFVERCKSFVGNKSWVNLRYLSVMDALNFLNIIEFFDDDEIIHWLIEKLHNCLDDSCFEIYPESKYYWKTILKLLKNDINTSIEYLEAKLG